MTAKTRKALEAVAAIAKRNRGTFTIADAEACGLSRRVLMALVRQEQVTRFDRGVYAVLDQSWTAHYYAAWRKVGEDAVLSHASALELLELGDVAPKIYEFTVPRARRSRDHGKRFKFHTAEVMPKTRRIHGVPVTSPARSIVDASTRVSEEQIELAVAQALERGIVTIRSLRAAATSRTRAVRARIDRAIDLAVRGEVQSAGRTIR